MTLIPPLGPNRHVRRGVEWSCATSVTLDEGVEPDLRRDSLQPLDDELALLVRGTSRLQHRPQPAAPAVAGPSTMPSQRTGADRRRLLRACPSPDFRHKLLLDGHPSETDLSRCDDDKVSSQATRMLGGEVYDIAADLTTGLRRVPEQDNAQARLSLCEHELTEVFILGQQDPTVTRGKISNFGVRCLCVCISHGDDIVSRAPQGADYGIVAAFVCQEAHLLTGMLNEYRLVVGDRLGGKTDGGSQVLKSDPRIRLEKVVLRRSLAQLSQ